MSSSDSDSVDGVAAAADRLARLTAELAHYNQATAPAGGGLVPAGGDVPAEQMKTQLAAMRSEVERRRAELDDARQELERCLSAKVAEANRVLEPMKKLAARLEEGIQAVNLYLGRDETIVELADGDPAPAGTPITIRQLVLAMDEETAIAAEDGGIDARDLEAFDEWITSDPAHLTQVLPEAKGVVVLQPRRAFRDYGDPWVTASLNEANQASYWLIRNGDRLWRMTTEIRVGDRLIPTRDEFTSFFVTRRWTPDGHATVPLEPGSAAWMRAEEAADARKRHFMKTALVLQGLVERTPVFHPLPAPEVSVLHPESYDAGHVVVVTDGELALGTGREPFRKWLRRLNRELRTGMRIVGSFHNEAWRNANDYERRWGRHSRLSPEGADPPESEVIHTIEDRRGDGALVIRYDRTDKRYGYEHGDWGRWGEWPYKKRAACVLYPDDTFVLPFDLVTVEEMEAYLTDRTERHAYIDMFPVLKAAIAAKKTEAAEEAPFRELLTGEIARACGVEIEDAEAAVPELVDWWKLTNRWHRPLVTPDRATQAKAVRMIVAEYNARRHVAAGGTGRDGERLAQIVAQHPDALLVGRKRDGTYAALLPADAGDVYVHQATWTATGRARHQKRWTLPGVGWKAWTVLHESERWRSWDHAATAAMWLTAPELAHLSETAVTTARDMAPAGAGPVAVVHDPVARTLEVIFDDLPAVEPSDWQVSTRPRVPKVTGVRFRWRRTSGRQVELTSSSTIHLHVASYDRWPWSRTGGDTVETVPAGHRKTAVVWLDLHRQAALRAAIDAHAAAAELRSNLADAVRASVNAVLDQWTADAEAAAYERFLEDYRDPDLWEGHRKTLKIRPPDGAGDALWQRVALLVNHGHLTEAMTVAEVERVFASVVSSEDRPEDERGRVYRDNGWLQSPTEMPDGFHEFVVPAVARPEGPQT